MTDAYIVDCTPLCDETLFHHALTFVDETRREKSLQRQGRLKQAQSLAVGLLMRRFLGGNLLFSYGKHGKPYLKNSDTHFSISHTEQWVVLAVSNTEIGVDIQTISPIRASVLRRCYTDAERDWVADDPHRFTQLWTMKEAYLKYLGAGFSLSPASFEVRESTVAHAHHQTDNYHLSLFGADSISLHTINVKDLL